VLQAAKLATAHSTAQMFGIRQTQASGWKKQALAGLSDISSNGRDQVRQQADAEKDELKRQIGQLKLELDCLTRRSRNQTGCPL